MQLPGWVEDLQDRFRPLKSNLFPQQVLLELHDHQLLGQSYRNHRPGPLSIDAPLPALTCRGGMPLEKEPLGDLIGDLLVRDGLLDAYVMAVLPSEATDLRVIDWSRDERPEDLESALRQLDPPLRLRQPLADCAIDFHPLPGRPNRMLMVAAPRELIDSWIEVFDMAGAQLECLAPAQSCQLRALQPLLRMAPAGQLIAMVDPQSEENRMVLFQAGVPVFERALPLDAADFEAEFLRSVAFYRDQDAQAGELRLLWLSSLPFREQLETSLGLDGELLDIQPFGSLALKGLTDLEVSA